jgi:hypothetical protein
MVVEIATIAVDTEGVFVSYRVIGSVTGYSKWVAPWMAFTWQSLCERMGRAAMAADTRRREASNAPDC